ncbi:hypothetical protein CARUB_v10010706mg [Capsella rubella]|uniref:Uncharacterized protein n=1 Tax=Capsella rubella TaxID=81985 RepID=R0IDR7_9BRAS|nr:uncharacterized protein LOC17899862 [Capsella rubella]EOA36345.1 hypothetical protein CARUB_v10010706mg [Capsella rubella]
MWCACYHQPLLSSSVVLRRKQVVCSFVSSCPISLSQHQWQIKNYPKIGIRLIKPQQASVLPPSESGDITTFLLVSGVMISMYLVTNFLVPSLLFKSLQGEEEEEEDSD